MKNAIVITASCLVFSVNYAAYDKDYWEYQKYVGEAGGILDKFKFQEHINPENTVIDLGCGGGFLLNQISCKKKIGVELNPIAGEHARSAFGIEVYTSVDKVPDGIADVIISNHALEHIPNVYEVLKELIKKLKAGGIVVFVVPSEQSSNGAYLYKENDSDQHLFSWTPMTFGNLLKAAGFSVVSSEPLRHCWVGDWQQAAKSNNLASYHEACRKHAINTNNYQVKAIGKK